MKRIIFSLLILFLTACATGPKITDEQLKSAPETHLINGVEGIRQGPEQCGPTALAMVMNFYGVEADKDKIWKYISPSIRGTPYYAMEDYSRRHGFNVKVLRDKKYDRVKYLLSQNHPLIIRGEHRGRGGRLLGHYVVLVGYDEKREKFWVMDPIYGYILPWSYDNLRKFHSSTKTKMGFRIGPYYTLWIYPKGKKG